MPDSLDYRDRQTPAPATNARRTKLRSTLLVGVSALSIGLGLLLLPLLLGRWEFNKFLVVAGLVSACWGICCLLLGAIDRIRQVG
jgi:hypothetical protein